MVKFAVLTIMEFEVSRPIAIDMYQWLREICSWRLLNRDDLRLGAMATVRSSSRGADR